MEAEEKSNESAPVAFTIVGNDLDVEGISRALGLNPTHSHRAGDVGMLAKTYPHDMWQLDSPLTAAEPEEHLKWLRSKLHPNYDYIRSLKGRADIYIYCGYSCEGEQGGFSLTPEALSLFTELGIVMEVHVLF